MLAWLEKSEFSPYKSAELELPGVYGWFREQEPKQVTKVGQLVHGSVITVSTESTAAEAIELMSQHLVHHLPVVEEDCLVGLVSDRDLFEAEEREDTLVSEIMALRLLTAREDSSIWQVAQIMLNHKINCVLVVDDHQHLLGLVTSLDILALMTHQAPVQVWG